jgi:hypothetical protein
LPRALLAVLPHKQGSGDRFETAGGGARLNIRREEAERGAVVGDRHRHGLPLGSDFRLGRRGRLAGTGGEDQQHEASRHGMRFSPHGPGLLCRRLDGESLRAICAEAGKPHFSTVMQWVVDDRDGFQAKYRCAREVQAHNLAERALAEAMSARGNEDAQAARLRFDALRWYAGKLLPKVYGERVEVDQTTRAVVSDEPMSADEWFAKYGDKSAPEWIAKFGDKSSPGPERAH